MNVKGATATPGNSSARPLGTLIISVALVYSNFTSLLVTVNVGGHEMSITNLGSRIGNTNLFNLVDNATGIGFYLLIGSVLLAIILAMAAFTSKINFTPAAFTVAIVLFFLDQINRQLVISSIVIHNTNGLNVNIQPNFSSIPGVYVMIIVFTTLSLVESRNKNN